MLLVLMLGTEGARGQDALGGGRALDANLNTTDGRINRSSQSSSYRLRNQLVTGNVVAGRGFRESVGYTAEFDFRGETGSDDLFSFRADSALSSPEFITYGATIQQFRFGQDLGLLVGYEQASSGTGLNDVVGMSTRSPVFRTSRAEWQLNRLGTISTLDSRTERESEPLIVGEVTSGESRLLVHTSSLQGVYTVPFENGAQIIGVSNYDLARARDDRDTGDLNYEFGSGFATRYTPGHLGGTGVDETASTRVNSAYDAILQSVADRYGTNADEPDPASSAGSLTDMMNQVREHLMEFDRANEVSPDDTPDETTPPPAFDPTNAAGDLLRHGERIVALTDSEAGRFDELIKRGEKHLTAGEYFHAERRFEHALRITPAHPMASAGLCHAQLGAKLYQSAATTLRTMFILTPEMIDTRYESGIIPSNDELRRIADDLKSTLRTTYDPLGYALLLAYIGHQLDDRELVRTGLERMEAANEDEEDRLIPLLQVIWLGG